MNTIVAMGLTGGLFIVVVLIPLVRDWISEKATENQRQSAERAKPAPWVEPRELNSIFDKLRYPELRGRLTLIEDRSAEDPSGLLIYFQDLETGQFWMEFAEEVGFSQFTVLSPIGGIPERE